MSVFSLGRERAALTRRVRRTSTTAPTCTGDKTEHIAPEHAQCMSHECITGSITADDFRNCCDRTLVLTVKKQTGVVLSRGEARTSTARGFLVVATRNRFRPRPESQLLSGARGAFQFDAVRQSPPDAPRLRSDGPDVTECVWSRNQATARSCSAVRNRAAVRVQLARLRQPAKSRAARRPGLALRPAIDAGLRKASVSRGQRRDQGWRCWYRFRGFALDWIAAVLPLQDPFIHHCGVLEAATPEFVHDFTGSVVRARAVREDPSPVVFESI